MRAWLGLGSNLQQPVAQVRGAIDRIGSNQRLAILQISSLYRTPPWGDEFQDDFINAVLHIETNLDPLALLRELQGIETEMGRLRNGRRWGPRLIDIDLLLYADLQFKTGELELPHPRMFERAFVLVPLAELDENLEIPGYGVTRMLLQQVDCAGISRLEEGAGVQPAV